MKLIQLVVLLNVLFCVCLAGQSNKKFKGTKHQSKREIAKLKVEGDRRNQMKMPFAPAQNINVAIDTDLYWKAQTGNTIQKGAGNVSLIEPSKYGLRDDLEVQTYLPANYWIPNVLLKKRWSNGDLKISSRHGLGSATPGFSFAQSHQYYSIVDSGVTVPLLLSLKNEVVVSKLFFNKSSCSANQTKCVVSAGLGFDIGFYGDDLIGEVEEPFLANRSAALTGNGYMAYVFAGVILPVNQTIMVNAVLTYFRGSFSGSNAFEQKTFVEFVFQNRFSTSIGYNLSVANYSNTKPVMVLPMIDLTWYFGRATGREKGLFGKEMR